MRREREVREKSPTGTVNVSAETKEPPRALPVERAVFPPSRRDINSITRVKGLLSKNTPLNEQLFTNAALRAEVPSNSRAAIWPMVLTTQDLSAVDTIPVNSGPIAPEAIPEQVLSPAPLPSRLELLKENQRRKILREAGLPEDYLDRQNSSPPPGGHNLNSASAPQIAIVESKDPSALQPAVEQVVGPVKEPLPTKEGVPLSEVAPPSRDALTTPRVSTKRSCALSAIFFKS
jgi:hypothetical protein